MYVYRPFNGHDGLTVSTLCTYSDLGSGWYSAFKVALVEVCGSYKL